MRRASDEDPIKLSLLSWIVRSSVDAILSADLDGIVTSWNPAAERIYGYSASEAIGQSVPNLIHPANANEWLEILQNIRNDQSVEPYEAIRMTKDGSAISVSLTIAPLHDSNGAIVGSTSIARDISEQKKVERYVRMMASIIESSDDAISSSDLAGIITSWNPTAERMYGYSADEMIGQSAVSRIAPETRDETLQITAKIRDGQTLRGYETIRVRKDGTAFPVSLTLSPIRDARGVVVGLSSIARDISEQKQAERYVRRMASIIKSSDDAIIGTDPDGIITSWNPAAERMYGYSAEEMIGQSVSLRIPPENMHEFAEIEAIIRNGETLRQYETVRVRKDGTAFPVSLTLSPIRDSRGVVVGLSSIARDISEQKQAEAYIRRMASIIESSDDAIISTDLEGVITSWNPGAERMYGYAADEMIGQSVSPLIPPENMHEVTHIEAKIRNGETLRRHETVRVRKDGSNFPVSLTLSPIRNTKGEIIGLSSIGREISEQKRTERYVRMMASIVEASEDAILSTNLDGIITSWNPAAERTYGYSADEAIGQIGWKLIPPDRKDELQTFLDSARNGQQLSQVETVRVRKDGVAIPVSISGSPIHDDGGAVVGMVLVVRDISEQKRNAEHARMWASIVESSDDAINGADLNGIVTNWNAAAERMFGYSAEEIVGQSVSLIIPAENKAELDFSLTRIEGGQKMETFETTRVGKDGRVIPVSLTISPIRDAKGAVIGSSAIARDISEQKRAARRLQKANELRNEFVAMVVHDVRSPATSISGFAHLLLDRWNFIDEDTKLEHLKVIARNTEHLVQFVEDVLQIARIEAGGFDFNIRPFDIRALAQKAILDMAGSGNERRFELVAAEKIPLVMGDEERQSEILMNLLSNAVKFSSANQPVTIGLSSRHGEVEVAVTDHGSGIAQEDQTKLFQKFGRVAQPEGQKVPGTGLGLYICKTMVEAQGGRIWCESTIGKGSTFAYTIPSNQ
jgi:PAS domain S-box-containing protein